MTRYKNLNRNSSVIGFEIFLDYIDVLFEDKSLYRYNYIVTGIAHVEQMKLLAQQGSGLCTYINKFVRKKYSNKLIRSNVSLT
jgi:hypothetical protein